MRKDSQAGSTSVIIAVVSTILLIGVSVFAAWAFSGRQDYKNNVTPKINAAVDAAKTAQANQDKQKFDQEAKNPNKTYTGSSTYGSISFKYPKTWSAYVDESNAQQPLEGYFYPDKVPGVQSNTAYALRVELVSTAYAQVVQSLSSQVKQGKVRAAAYVPPMMVGKANVQPGTRFDGAVVTNSTGTALQGSLIVIAVRDKTMEFSTQDPAFLPDFNNTILPSLNFIP